MILAALVTGPAVDRFDGPEWALVIVATIGAVSSIVGLAVANRSRHHSQVVRTQVENHHADAKNPNLRVDLDEKERASEERDKQTNRKLDRVATDIHAIKDDLGTVKDDLTDVIEQQGLLREGYAANRERIRGLEDTEAKRRQAAEWGPPTTRRERREGSR